MDGWMDETDGNGSGDVQDPSDLGLGLGDAKGRAVNYVARRPKDQYQHITYSLAP
jgi:hypothetical protein